MGVVHHTNYPVWFEMGRTELLRSTGYTYRDIEEAGYLLAVVKLEVSYKSPARYDDLIRVDTSLWRVTAVKVEHHYKVWRGEDLLATGATTLACLDREGKPRMLPDAILHHPVTAQHASVPATRAPAAPHE